MLCFTPMPTPTPTLPALISVVISCSAFWIYWCVDGLLKRVLDIQLSRRILTSIVLCFVLQKSTVWRGGPKPKRQGIEKRRDKKQSFDRFQSHTINSKYPFYKIFFLNTTQIFLIHPPTSDITFHIPTSHTHITLIIEHIQSPQSTHSNYNLKPGIQRWSHFKLFA